MPENTRGRGTSDGRAKAAESRRTRRRRQLLKSAAGAGSLALAGCLDTYDAARSNVLGSSDGDVEPVTIGLLAPNPDSDFIGRSMARAAQVAIDHLEDGIDGREVELAVGDTASNPLEARREYQRLVLEEGADVTVGVFDSASLVNILDDVAEQETIHLTSGAATSVASRLVSEDYDRYKYHFRVGPTNEFDLGLGVVDFVGDVAPDIGWESVALLAEDYDWTEGPWSVYQERLAETGVDVVVEDRYPAATDDFESRYDRAVETGADVALVTMAHTGTDAVLDWTYPNRPEPEPRPYPFAFGGIHVPMQLPTYYDQTDGACLYGFGLISATAESDVGELTQPFVEAYERSYGEYPVYTGYTTYEAILLYAAAVEEADTTDEDEVIPVLEDIQFQGATGTIEFYDRDHEYPHDLAYNRDDTLFFQWQERDGEGVQEVIWPEEHATSEYVSPAWIP